jgi:hypothetical protein
MHDSQLVKGFYQLNNAIMHLRKHKGGKINTSLPENSEILTKNAAFFIRLKSPVFSGQTYKINCPLLFYQKIA